MGRVYTISNILTTVTAAETLVEIGAATNTILEIMRIKLTQSTSETDDSALITWGTYTTSGTGTNVAAKALPNDPGDSAFSGTAEDNHTADISVGEVLLGQEGISLLAGMEKIYLPGSELIIPGAGFFGLNLDTVVTSVTMVYEIEFREKG